MTNDCCPRVESPLDTSRPLISRGRWFWSCWSKWLARQSEECVGWSSCFRHSYGEKNDRILIRFLSVLLCNWFFSLTKMCLIEYLVLYQRWIYDILLVSALTQDFITPAYIYVKLSTKACLGPRIFTRFFSFFIRKLLVKH